MNFKEKKRHDILLRIAIILTGIAFVLWYWILFVQPMMALGDCFKK